MIGCGSTSSRNIFCRIVSISPTPFIHIYVEYGTDRHVANKKKGLCRSAESFLFILNYFAAVVVVVVVLSPAVVVVVEPVVVVAEVVVLEAVAAALLASR